MARQFGTRLGPYEVIAQIGMGMAFLGLTWFVTTGMAFAVVRRRRFELHKEWMIRSYVVTFAFVNFRIFVGVTETMGVGTESKRVGR